MKDNFNDTFCKKKKKKKKISAIWKLNKNLFS